MENDKAITKSKLFFRDDQGNEYPIETEMIGCPSHGEVTIVKCGSDAHPMHSTDMARRILEEIRKIYTGSIMVWNHTITVTKLSAIQPGEVVLVMVGNDNFPVTRRDAMNKIKENLLNAMRASGQTDTTLADRIVVLPHAVELSVVPPDAELSVNPTKPDEAT